jgi:type II secretory pathway component PulJ
MIRRRLTTASRQGGFTLTEMLVSMIFIGIMFAMFALVVSSTLRHDDEVREESTLQAETRGAIDQLAQDLRSAYSGDDSVAPIESIGASTITFLSPNRQEPFSLRRIEYRLNGGVLQRRMATSTDTDGYPWTIPALPSTWDSRVKWIVNSTLFTYLDTDGLATSNPADVARVTITVKVATPTAPTRQFTYTTSVTLRATTLS